RLKTDGVPHSEGMDELLVQLLWGSLQSLGLFREQRVVADSAGSWPMATGLLNTYARWFEETIRTLELAGYLQRDREALSVKDPTPVDLNSPWRAWDERKQAWLAAPNQKALVVLVEQCLRALPAILTGKSQATDIMFPNGSMELVEGIYKGNVVADYFNEVLSDTVVAYIREVLRTANYPASLAGDSSGLQAHMPQGLRILEIGAGTGGTTATVLPKLTPYRAHIREYCYTDISRAFLLHAQREYAPEHPFLTLQLFDVEQSIAAQGIEAGGYDLIIATNVLHATKNIRRTLANAKAVLRKGGLLLLNELNRNALCVHLTFGLLEGWWRYEDAALRLPGCPGLTPETWARVLQEEGFPTVLFPAEASHGLGQHIIVAQSDGIVRQARAHDAAPARTARQGAAPAVTRVERIEGEPAPTTPPTPLRVGVRDLSNELLRDKSTVLLKQLVADTLKMSPRQIASAVSLEEYGIDSIVVIQLTNAFREVFDQVSSTLFFEVQTIDALVDYFMATQRDALIRLVQPQHDFDTSGETAAHPAPAPRPRGFDTTRRFARAERLSEAVSTSGRAIFTVHDIAVIGLSGRYPGARDGGEFWQRLKAGTNCVGEIPHERWDWRKFYDAEKGKLGTSYSRWGGFLDDVDKFDPLFFQISPREAESMDPQERLFLETVYASIEDSGYTPPTLCSHRTR